MKTLFLAAAAVLAIGAGVAQAETGEAFGWDKPAAQPTGQVVKTSMTTGGMPHVTLAHYSQIDSNG